MEAGTTDHVSARHPRMQFFQPRVESDVALVGKEMDWIQEDLVHHHEVEDGIALPWSHLSDDPMEPCRFPYDLFRLSKVLHHALDHAVDVCEEVDNSQVDAEDNHEIGEVEGPRLDRHHMACTGHQGVHKALDPSGDLVQCQDKALSGLGHSPIHPVVSVGDLHNRKDALQVGPVVDHIVVGELLHVHLQRACQVLQLAVVHVQETKQSLQSLRDENESFRYFVHRPSAEQGKLLLVRHLPFLQLRPQYLCCSGTSRIVVPQPSFLGVDQELPVMSHSDNESQ